MRAFWIFVFCLISIHGFGQVNFGANVGLYTGQDHAAIHVGALVEVKAISRLRWEMGVDYANSSAMFSGRLKFYPIKKINLNFGYYSLTRIFSQNKSFFVNTSGFALGTEGEFNSKTRLGIRFLSDRLERIIPSQQKSQLYNVQIYLGYTFRKD